MKQQSVEVRHFPEIRFSVRAKFTQGTDEAEFQVLHLKGEQNGLPLFVDKRESTEKLTVTTTEIKDAVELLTATANGERFEWMFPDNRENFPFETNGLDQILRIGEVMKRCWDWHMENKTSPRGEHP